MSSYEQFYDLHKGPKPLIIANAWNTKSARILEQGGYDAVATSSGAIADSLGYKDGEVIPFGELLYVVKRIKSGISIPLSVDMERGYTQDMRILENNIQQLIDAGVAGINIEDAEGEELYLRKLGCIKEYLEKTNQQLFINARTDAFLQKLPAPLETTLRRAKLYRDAGADGLFVTGVSDMAVIKKLATEVQLPLNVAGTPALPSVAALAESGVKRISMAVFLYRATYNKLEQLAAAVLTTASFTPLF